jgi:hypothetical protein
MLVPAMAFAWCVISAEATASPPNAVRVHPKTLAGASAPSSPAAPGEQRVSIRGPIPAEVIAYAKTLVNLAMGEERIAEIDGQRYIFVLEHHYHPQGFVGAPNGWHKGVTAYELH